MNEKRTERLLNITLKAMRRGRLEKAENYLMAYIAAEENEKRKGRYEAEDLLKELSIQL